MIGFAPDPLFWKTMVFTAETPVILLRVYPPAIAVSVYPAAIFIVTGPLTPSELRSLIADAMLVYVEGTEYAPDNCAVTLILANTKRMMTNLLNALLMIYNLCEV